MQLLKLKLSRKLANQLVASNLALAQYALGLIRMPRAIANRHYGELQSEAYLALVHCSRNFDCAHGARFSTCAVRHIKRRLINYINRVRRGPASAGSLALEGEVPARPDVGPVTEAGELERMWSRVASLPPRHAAVLRRCYADGATLDEVAAELGRSRETVRQIVRHGVTMLRSRFYGVDASLPCILRRGRA